MIFFIVGAVTCGGTPPVVLAEFVAPSNGFVPGTNTARLVVVIRPTATSKASFPHESMTPSPRSPRGGRCHGAFKSIPGVRCLVSVLGELLQEPGRVASLRKIESDLGGGSVGPPL